MKNGDGETKRGKEKGTKLKNDKIKTKKTWKS